jgi:hypothetical protein
MNKGAILRKLEEYGDAVVYDHKSKSHKLVTIDFSVPYIKSRKNKWIMVEDHEVLVFNWSDDCFYKLDSTKIKEITPLSSILKNKG